MPDHGIHAAGRLDLGDGMAVLVDIDGHYFFEHWCDRHLRIPESEPYLIAPSLGAHTCAGPIETLTVLPSILCPDCGTHGFLTEGVWRGC
mgnify:CR=1 FL=1